MVDVLYDQIRQFERIMRPGLKLGRAGIQTSPTDLQIQMLCRVFARLAILVGVDYVGVGWASTALIVPADDLRNEVFQLHVSSFYGGSSSCGGIHACGGTVVWLATPFTGGYKSSSERFQISICYSISPFQLLSSTVTRSPFPCSPHTFQLYTFVDSTMSQHIAFNIDHRCPIRRLRFVTQISGSISVFGR
ncbi:uncharacterized protein BDZ99DRAFT_244234 [Mytilinidion resinicola]|uniref:Uncharacterized protein n=1 Tax=Mytilinidion resinicola TaxID=574789 RepID=A0A6A6YY19_9PEZI|nr:uncharacterized protein BDZ99DRAFT_244234 [Mytilinidion resinicola]KAF2812894.1 hypothetical protein BDZ99DRAFT_244234 [Mytilinidion resinicola]